MFIKRAADGTIMAISRMPVDGLQEQVPDDDPELLVFLKGLRQTDEEAFIASDLEMARVLEDVIDLLIDQQIIRITDLPRPAQQKLNLRQQMRRKSDAVDLLDDDDDLDI